MSYPRTHHQKNVSGLRGEKHNNYFSQILHQAGFKTARQAATSQSATYAPTTAPCPTFVLLTNQITDIKGPGVCRILSYLTNTRYVFFVWNLACNTNINTHTKNWLPRIYRSPAKKEMLVQCWFIVGLPSPWPSIKPPLTGWTYVRWVHRRTERATAAGIVTEADVKLISSLIMDCVGGRCDWSQVILPEDPDIWEGYDTLQI